MTWLARILTLLRKPVVDKLAPVQPRVTPDPQQVESLRKRQAAMLYVPANGFHAEQRQERATVLQFKRRAR